MPLRSGSKVTSPRLRNREKLQRSCAIYGYAGHPVTCAALKLAPMLFQRPHMEERIDLIEHQLAHAVRDVNGQSYNRTTHLAARRDMMQRWADYLDRIRNGS